MLGYAAMQDEGQSSTSWVVTFKRGVVLMPSHPTTLHPYESHIKCGDPDFQHGEVAGCGCVGLHSELGVSIASDVVVEVK